MNNMREAVSKNSNYLYSLNLKPGYFEDTLRLERDREQANVKFKKCKTGNRRHSTSPIEEKINVELCLHPRTGQETEEIFNLKT